MALLAGVRFLRADLMFLMIVLNSLVMMKAWPWDRYALPLVVAFWYFKSVGLDHQYSLCQRQAPPAGGAGSRQS